MSFKKVFVLVFLNINKNDFCNKKMADEVIPRSRQH